MTRTLHFALLAAILLASFAQASEAKDRDAELFEVREEQVPREIELEGTFEATETAEIVVRPKEWSNLVVERAVSPGTRVAQDEPVLWLETLKIDEQIADLQFEKELGKLQLQETESALAHFRTTLPLELRTAELSARTADEDYAYFREVGEPTSRKQAEFQVISAERSLEYVREELEQLKKMYRDDDLTEETEEIILQRARHQVESAEFRLETAKIQADRALEMDLPRRAQSLQDGVERTRLEYEKLIDSSARTMNQRKIELERARHNQEKTALRLENLQHDREQLTVRAPIEGIVYYGTFSQGTWSGADTTAQQLQQGSTMQPNRGVMTIVKPRPLVLKVQVSEEHRGQLTREVTGVAVPTAFPQMELPVEMDQLSEVPITPGQFRGVLQVAFEDDQDAVMPGMTAKVTLKTEEATALVVPQSAVFEQNDRHYVWVVNEEGEREKVAVTPGEEVNELIEIQEGLDAGQKVLARADQPDDEEKEEEVDEENAEEVDQEEGSADDDSDEES